MDRLTRALYATSAAAVLSLVAMVVVMIVVAAPGFSVAEDRINPDGGAPAAVMVGDFHTDVRAG